jgi:hypothetical protein
MDCESHSQQTMSATVTRQKVHPFFTLPSQLIFEIILKYLTLKEIACMDMAFVQHQFRDDFLSIITSTPTSYLPSYTKVFCATNVSQSCGLLYYMMKRELFMNKLTILPAKSPPSSPSGRRHRILSFSTATTTTTTFLQWKEFSTVFQPTTISAHFHKMFTTLEEIIIDGNSNFELESLLPLFSTANATTANEQVYFPNLKKLSIINYKKLSNDIFCQVFKQIFTSKHCPDLKYLDLSGNWQLQDEFLNILTQPIEGEKLPLFYQLESILFNCCFALTDEGFLQCLQSLPSSTHSSFPHLTYFACNYNDHIDEDVLELVLQACPRLRELHVVGAISLSNDFAEIVVDAPHNSLRIINVSGISRLTDEFLTSLAFYPYLEALHVEGCHKITSNAIQQFLVQVESLQVLSMRGVIQNLTRTEVIQNIQQSLLQQDSPRSKERARSLSIDM